MANTLILIDRRDYPFGSFTARVMWVPRGSDRVWIDSSGQGEFSGTGTIRSIEIPGESIVPRTLRVNGNTTVVAKSKNSH